jgi:hypothetical protein
MFTRSLEAETMRLDANGNVGIGTSSPTARLTVSGSIHLGSFSDSSTVIIDNRTSRNIFTISTDGDVNAAGTTLSYSWANGGQGPLKFANASGEVMRLDAIGNVGIGTTSATAGGVTVKTHISGGDFGLGISVSASGSQQNIRFVNGTTAVGSVTTTSSITTYNTVSDYRLKQDLKNIKGLDLISKIKVYDYKWKIDNSRSYGVLAHELQEVVPYAVRGEKDAKEMQQVDYSKLVPILVQAIQELQEKINKLENK